MKFALLDTRVRDDRDYSSSKYQYLDELLDKTFVTDYFLDRSISGGGLVTTSESNTTKP
jgi:hypothetical protein